MGRYFTKNKILIPGENMSDILQGSLKPHGFPMPDFSIKRRVFRFEATNTRVDTGRCSAYWTMADGRKCISEYTVDRQGNLYETYFFSSEGIEALSPKRLFERVKDSHLSYEHDPDIELIAKMILDSAGQNMWSVDVCIAKEAQLLRTRPPYFLFYHKPNIPIVPTWSLICAYREAQNKSVPFILVQGDTGSASWRDRETYILIGVENEALLNNQLRAHPCKVPIEDYKTFNLTVIDTRDLQQPFNEDVCTAAAQWKA